MDFAVKLITTVAKKLLDERVSRLYKPLLQHIYELNYAHLPGLCMQSLVFISGIFSLLRAPDFFKYDNIGLITDYNNLHSNYDFIIVGGGIEGCLIAKRLSDAEFEVLLVHGPGTTPNILLRAPFTSILNYGDPKHDYQYKGPIIPELKWDSNRITYSSGKDLGGSPLLNTLVWSYGTTGDYHSWKKSNISSKFSYLNIRKFGALHENAHETVNSGNFDYGRDGEIHLSRPDNGMSYSELADIFEKAGAEVTNTEILEDPNDDTLGFSRVIQAVEQETGFISTPTRAFFEKKYNKDKLHIITEHMVSKIIFDRTDKPPRATGVVIRRLKDNYSFNVTARLKVVLSGGPIKTPQLLTISGVGQSEVLAEFHIRPVAVREGVGRNLFDHYTIGSAAVCLEDGKKGHVDLSISELIRFTLNGTGITKNPYSIFSIGSFKSTSVHTTCEDPLIKESCRPDFELILFQIGPNTQPAAKWYLSSGLSMQRVIEDFYMMNKESAKNNRDALYHQKECLMFLPTLLHPEGRGTITLTSDDIMDNPIINIDPTASKRDMLLMGELYQIVKRIGNEGFAVKGGVFNKIEFSNCEHIKDKDSIEYGACQIKPYLVTQSHTSGTCRLGHRSDPLAVVDEDFHVIGVEDLMIVDASLLPSPVSGYALATVSAMAEMAAQQLIPPEEDHSS